LLYKGEWKMPSNGQKTFDFAKEFNIEKYDSLPFVVESMYNPQHEYHLYVAMGCPFAHSARIALLLKGLDKTFSISSVAVNSSDEVKGWCFDNTYNDKVFNKSALWELYVLDGNKYTIRASVPLLVDVTEKRAVINQSMDLMKLFNIVGKEGPNLFLEDPQFTAMLDKIVNEVNSGAYRSCFASTKSEYDVAVKSFFGALDYFEEKLSISRYLWSNSSLTACDIRLFVTLLRFEFVYHHLFDLNKKTLKEYPNLFNFTKELYQMPAIKSTINLAEIRQSYYLEFKIKFPRGIVPVGPDTNLDEPHDRTKF